MPLINFKIHLELNWTKNCVMSSIAGGTTFKITSTNLYVPIVTLSTKDNVNFTKQLNEPFKRPVYWNEYKSKIETKEADYETLTRFPLDASFQAVNRLFVLAFNNTDGNANQVERNSHRKYFLSRVDITKYNVLIDGRNFYNQPINDQIKKHDEITKISTGKGDDYTTGCLLDYQYLKDHYQLIVVDLSNVPHEFLSTTRQTTKLRNAIENNMPTDIKLPKCQISKIIQSGGYLGSLLSKLVGPLMKVAVPLGKKYFSTFRINYCNVCN